MRRSCQNWLKLANGMISILQTSCDNAKSVRQNEQMRLMLAAACGAFQTCARVQWMSERQLTSDICSFG